MEKLLAFQPVERVRHDSAPIALIYRNMGTVAAEEVVSRALAELALTLAALGEPGNPGVQDPCRGLRRIRRMAAQLGLVSLAQVAGDAESVLDRADAVATGAVWARLVRVAEVSLAPETARMDLRP